MPSFHHNDLRIQYMDSRPSSASDECALVFIHGAGSSSEIWEFQFEEFSPTHRVITVDLSGHGNSKNRTDSVSIEGFSMEILALVDYLGLERYTLIGHSMGGAVAMSYTLLPPSVMPLGLVLVGTSPDLEFGKIAPGLAIEALEYQFGLFRSTKAEKESRIYQIKKREEDGRRKRPSVFRDDLQACNDFDICDRIQELRLPTFCIVGEDDDIITPNVMSAFEKQLPRADFAVIPRSDHCPMLDNAPHFNRVLRDFVEYIECST